MVYRSYLILADRPEVESLPSTIFRQTLNFNRLECDEQGEFLGRAVFRLAERA